MVKVSTTFHRSTIKALLAVAATISLAPLSSAGTYSIVSVEWFPAAPTTIDGGYMRFGTSPSGENPLDIHFGLVKSIQAPILFTSFTATAQPWSVGNWRWKVRWVGAPGEPAPGSVNGTVQTKAAGGGYTRGQSSSASRPGWGTSEGGVSFIGSYAASAYQLNGSPNTNPFPWHEDSDSLSDDEVIDYTGITFTHVSGTTYEGWASHAGEAQADLEAYGEYGPGDELPVVYSTGIASVNINAISRLTHIAGVRVQSDLP